MQTINEGIKKMKKLFIILFLILMVSGCSYGKITNEDITIDMTKVFDTFQFADGTPFGIKEE